MAISVPDETQEVRGYDPDGQSIAATIDWVKRNYAYRPGQDDEFVGQLIDGLEAAHAALRELRAHPLRHLAHDRSPVVIDTAAIRHDLCEHGSYYVADNDWRVCLSCGVALPVSDPQRRNGE